MAERKFVICIDNTAYPASLEFRKLYEVLPNPEAAKHGQLRVIDESGEDYLYPASIFVHVVLPKHAQKAITQAALYRRLPVALRVRCPRQSRR